jgi:hypothetical protein
MESLVGNGRAYMTVLPIIQISNNSGNCVVVDKGPVLYLTEQIGRSGITSILGSRSGTGNDGESQLPDSACMKRLSPSSRSRPKWLSAVPAAKMVCMFNSKTRTFVKYDA